jgi:magnesium transporter
MRTAFILQHDGTVSRDVSIESIGAALRDPASIFWVDIFQPCADDLKLLNDVFKFHPLAVQDSIEYTQRPKLESYEHSGDANKEGYYYLVFHGPDLETFRENLRTKEVDIFIGRRYLVSVHDEPMHSIDECRAKADADAVDFLRRGIDVLLYEILHRITDHYDTILDHFQETIDDLEEQAVTNPRPALLGDISAKKRELLNLRRIVGPQREVIAQISRGDVPFFRESSRVYFRDVQDHLARTVEMVELYRDLIMGARDIYLSSISNQLNQIMKTLTIISVIGLPLTIVTGFFGMNFDEPIFHDHRVFLGALVFMAFAVSGMLYLFKRKRWI